MPDRRLLLTATALQPATPGSRSLCNRQPLKIFADGTNRENIPRKFFTRIIFEVKNFECHYVPRSRRAPLRTF